MSKLTRLLMTLSLIVFGTAAAQATRVKMVDCDQGGKISRPLRNLPTPLEIVFTGTCEENLRITRSDVTIRGDGEDPTVVGSIFMSGSLRSALQDFTLEVVDAENAVEIQGGSSVRMQNFHVSEYVFRGILVDKGAEAVLAEVSAITTQAGAVIGLLARGGTIFLEEGLIELAGAVGGMSGTLGGRYFITGADVFLHDNGTGAFFQVNAAVIFQTGTLRSTNNSLAGFIITSGATIHHGSVEIVASDNGIFGMLLQSNATITPFPSTTLTLDVSNNGPAGGIRLQSSAVWFIGAGTQTITGNLNTAILVDQLSNFQLRGTATVSGPDGSIVRLAGLSYVVLGDEVTNDLPIICDDTVQLVGPDCTVTLETARTAVDDPLEQVERILGKLQEGM